METNTSTRPDKTPLTLFIKLNGSNCNMRCSYCYSHVSSLRNPLTKRTSVDSTICYLSQFTQHDCLFIVFHGGEPLLTPIDDVKAILKFIFTSFEHHPNVQFQTNGTLLNSQWLRLFHEYQPHISLSFSIDPIGQNDLRFHKSLMIRNKVLANIAESNQYVPNVGVVAVAHRYNKDAFIPFIDELIELQVGGLTISKLSDPKRNLGDAYLSESEYVEVLLQTGMHWIAKKRYIHIRLQPFSSLLSKGGSRICKYLANNQKCSLFRTYQSDKIQSNFCDHVQDGQLPICPDQCKLCDIYQDCGGGCLLEEKDADFCESRHRLFSVINSIKR